MPATYIYKPGTYKGPVVLTPSEGTRDAPIIRGPNGQTFTGRYYNTNEGRHQFIFPRELYGLQDLTIEYGGQKGSIGSGSTSFEGNSLADWQARQKGSLGSGVSGGYPQSSADYTPGQDPTGHGFYPANLEGLFPNPVLAEYSPIKPAPYSFTDPAEYLKKFGDFQRGEIGKNANQASDIAMQQLDTELAGLKNFVPAAAALKRQQLAQDNLFNSAQRQGAVDYSLPGARQALAAQTERAGIYAEGRLPNALTDRALELNVRSRAADQGAAGGFGPQSAASGKISDLMSAEQRFAIAQYGEQALNQSIANRANLLLPPTQYSTVGQEVRSVPEVGAGRLSAQNLSLISQLASVPASQALSTVVQQNQFTTGLEQQTRQYNASNQLQLSEFNTGTQNSFALQKFGYQVGFAGAVAGAYQTGANTDLALQQQAQYQRTFQDNLAAAQAAGQANAIGQGLGALPGIISGINEVINGGKPAQPTQTAPSDETVPVETPAPGAVASSPTGEPIYPGGSTVAPSGTPEVIGSNADGTPIYNPESAPPSSSEPIVSPEIDNFLASQEIAKTGNIRSQNEVTQSLLKNGNVALNAAGISAAPSQQSVQIGYNNRGIPMYSNKALAQSGDATLGSRAANVFRGMLDPLGVLSNEDSSYLDRVATLSSDASFIASLGQNFANGDAKGFVGNLMGRMGVPLSKEISKDPQNQAGMQTAFNAYQLFSNWGRMSNAQKGLGLAALGLKGMYAATGKDIAKTPIIEAGAAGEGTPGLNVGEALNLFQSGYNVYHLVHDWNQMSTMDKLVGGTQTAASVANTARQFGLLGAGQTGAAVPGVTAGGLANAGFTSAPTYGIGGIVGPANAVPEGYTVTSQLANGQVSAVPTANLGSSSASQAGATGAQAGELTAGQTAGAYIGGAAGVATFAAGAYQVYKGWGTGGSAGARNGAVGGSMMAAGLYGTGTAAGALGYATYAGAATNPYVLAAVVAVSVATGYIHSGKEKGQMKRDGVRKFWDDSKFTDGDDNVTLADGTKFNIGREESFTHPVKDRNLLNQYSPGNNAGKRDLRGYEVDFTNDMDYASSMGGVALSRLLVGGKKANIDQMGGYLGNAALGNVGYGKEMNEENFGKSMQNMRGFYSQAGIKSKADAYALANQAYAEGRINDFDHASMLNTFNMMFDDNGYQTAQKLMAGRWRGLDVARDNPDANNNKAPSTAHPIEPPEGRGSDIDPGFSLNKDTGFFKGPYTWINDAGMNAPTTVPPSAYLPGSNTPEDQRPTWVNNYGDLNTNYGDLRSATDMYFQNNQVPKRGRLTKEEIIAANRARYGA